MRCVCILQARMGSTRLPQKVLLPVLRKPLLEWMIERVRRAKTIDTLVVATTVLPEDDAIADLCNRLKVPVFRGSDTDVLSRYFEAANTFDADIVVRLTGDCPLLDPAIIDDVVNYFKNHSFDHVSNTRKITFPRGMDVEVFSKRSLDLAYREAKDAYSKEHVTPYINEHPDLFSLGNVELSPPSASYRLTVDTPEDFQLIKKILEALAPIKPEFTLQDLLTLLHEHPEWSKINAHIKQKTKDAT